MSTSRIPWGKIGEIAADVAVALLGAWIASRQQPAAPAQPTAPRSRPPAPDFPARADAEITARGHAGIEERFPPEAPLAPHVGGYRSAPAPTPLPGSALRGEAPADPDQTEPDDFGPRDMQ